MPKKRRNVPLLDPVGGVQPNVSEVDDGDPAKYALGCPECGAELGRHRFLPLARRTFEEHVDEEHPSVASPLDQIRTLVDLAETEPGTWVCEVAGNVYTVHEVEDGKYKVEMPSLNSTVDADLGRLDEARIVIGGHAGVVSTALGLAATMAMRRTAPENAIPLS
ncbi:hypothetical protein [Streptomyces lydicus]|uniref:hypothetical protein n=1 Tax=Streptomyces lydicus TaxID=47763 RepID=UPI00101130E1|nr:hypothetical protein [Streptomyces lydicus]MCZ1012173.1 hypothetical protein [Streptomyces lydicus]